jgi:rhomboid protease GluP
VLNTWATTLIVGVNLLAFAATYVVAGSAQIDVDTLIRFGANDRVVTEQSWRLVACTFLHIDAMAMLANMWWLIWTGTIVERRLGSRSFLGFYLICAVGASITSTTWQPTAVSVGASGAVWGMWGMIIAMTLFDSKSSANAHLKTVCGFVMIAIVADLCSVPWRPGIDTAAHLGGLLTGMTTGAAVFVVAAVAVRRARQFSTNVSLRLATS